MRIAISGTAGMGKSTVVKDFLAKWSNYKSPEKSYRELLKEGNHSSKTNQEVQWDILNLMVDQLQATSKNDKVIFDRCPLDNLAYTLWACEKGLISDEFLGLTIPIVKESMRALDIIFLIQYDPKIKIEESENRDANEEYIREIDAIFNGLYDQYINHLDTDTFYPKDDSPCVIPIYGNRVQRILQIADYLDGDGDLINTEESILDIKNLEKVEGLLKAQQDKLLFDQSSNRRFMI